MEGAAVYFAALFLVARTNVSIAQSCNRVSMNYEEQYLQTNARKTLVYGSPGATVSTLKRSLHSVT